MKILSRSRYQSDESLLESLVGKELWVKVKDLSDIKFKPLIWLQIVSSHDAETLESGRVFEYPYYLTHWILDSDLENLSYYVDEAGAEFVFGGEIPFYKKDIDVIHPVEILTTEELITYEE